MSNLFKSKPGFEVSESGDGESLISVTLPVEEDGLTSRYCPNEQCCPRYFKIKTGTGLPESLEPEIRCPYCGTGGSGQEFHTPAQHGYVEALVAQQMESAVGDMLQDTFRGFNRSGDGLVTIKVEFQRESLQFIPKPEEGWVRRQITCDNCSLVHAVYGLSLWCPDCGFAVFPLHVEGHLATLMAMISDLPRREECLGAEVAQRDVDNILEDVVTFYEGFLKFLDKQALARRRASGPPSQPAKRQSGLFQRLLESLGVLKQCHGFDWQTALSEADADRLDALFQSRHVLTHNLGIADDKFVEKTGRVRERGRDIRVHQQDLEFALPIVAAMTLKFYGHLAETGAIRRAP